MKGWQGVTGQITAFTPKGEVIKNVELQVVRSGIPLLRRGERSQYPDP
jgi:hypothetical protein